MTLNLIIALFALAIVMGALLISYIFKGKKPPLPLAMLHGIAAAGALGVLIAFSAKNNITDFTGVLFIFCIAALGGVTLVFRHYKGKSLPKWLAGIHGGLALMGFILLVMMVFSA